MVDIAHISGFGRHRPPSLPPSPMRILSPRRRIRLFVVLVQALIMCRAEHAKAVDKTLFPGLQGWTT